MNLLIFCNQIVALAAATTLLVGSVFVSTAYAGAKESRHHKSSHDSSCCKSAKKRLKSIAQTLESIKKHEKKECCETQPISQKTIDKAGGALVLRHSGNYALTEDVTGTIALASNSICLDLCCHTLSAGGRANAVVTTSFQDLKVFNGRIINSSDAAILVTNSSAVELYSLVLNNNSLDGIRQTNSTDLSVHDVDFINNNSGERALHFDTCSNINVKNCAATGFLTTLGAIVQLDTCKSASLADIDVTNNTKSSGADVQFFAPGTAFVSVNACEGVSLERVLVTNNTINNNLAVSDPDTNWRTFEGIMIQATQNCRLDQCQTSNNTDIAGDTANVDTEDYFLCIIGCDNCIVTSHQSNNNSSPAALPAYFGGAIFDSTDIVFDGCQFNSNFMQTLSVAPFEALMMGLLCQQYFIMTPENVVIRNTQANFNMVGTGGAGRTSDLPGVVEGMDIVAFDAVIENCQANNNGMRDIQENTAVIGMGLPGTGMTVTRSTADGNFGSTVAVGMVLEVGADIKVSKCSASSNANAGILIGFVGITDPSENVIIEDCVMYGNGGAPVFFAAGINAAAGPNFSPTNILIRGCQISDTASVSTIEGDAAGISISNASNVVIEDTNVYSTTSENFDAHGILLDACTDSKIIHSQVHQNQNSGIEIEDANSTIAIISCVAMDNDIGINFAVDSAATCSLVQDSRALHNRTAGFSYNISAAPTSLTVTFIGNEAQCNGVCIDHNFENLTTRINLQQLSWTDGAITPVNPIGPGEAAIGARFTNLEQGPACSPP